LEGYAFRKPEEIADRTACMSRIRGKIDMKSLLIAFTIIFVAAVWMAGSWYFFNSIGDVNCGLSTPACGGSPLDLTQDGQLILNNIAENR
jgi:hypothetical protein